MWWWLIWKSFHFTEALQKTDVCCATDWYKLTLMLSQSLTHPASDCMHLENKQLLYESIITSAWLQNWSWTPTFLTGKDLIPFDYLAALWTSWSFSGNLSNFSSFFFASCMERDIAQSTSKCLILYKIKWRSCCDEGPISVWWCNCLASRSWLCAVSCHHLLSTCSPAASVVKQFSHHCCKTLIWISLWQTFLQCLYSKCIFAYCEVNPAFFSSAIVLLIQP